MRAGDKVSHSLTGEIWTLSTNPEGGFVTWYGWPEGEAYERDCTLVKACTDADHRKALEDWGGKPHRTDSGRFDLRYLRAYRQLCDLNQNFIGAEI